ncbi:MAG: hypothetical protein IJU01_02705 [Lachnospiraceae bacterium]|nr:hypothetical protein [Lachnospiraceae bacterium]
MYWQKKRLKYDILVPPISKPFKKFTPKEAEDFFQWYISQIDSRVRYLQDYSGVELDYTVDSLIDIWEWFIKNAEIEKTPQKKINELKKDLKKQPANFARDILNEQSKQFTLETEYIINDIVMYFGEVYVRNNSSIIWGYSTDKKARGSVNEPVLIGFKDRDFDPPARVDFQINQLIHIVADGILCGDPKKEDLFEQYYLWQGMVFN